MEKVFLKECFLADIIKYDALSVWGQLQVGTKLILKLDSTLYNSGKKCIFANKPEDNGMIKKIGVLTEEDAKMMDQIMSMGWNEVFLCYVSQVDDDATNDQRIKVAIYIKRNQNQNE